VHFLSVTSAHARRAPGVSRQAQSHRRLAHARGRDVLAQILFRIKIKIPDFFKLPGRRAREGACTGAATMTQPSTLRLIRQPPYPQEEEMVNPFPMPMTTVPKLPSGTMLPGTMCGVRLCACASFPSSLRGLFSHVQNALSKHVHTACILTLNPKSPCTRKYNRFC
jgi:hypothetical protein